MIHRTRLSLVFLLLVGASCVHGTVYSAPFCRKQCLSEANFIQDLPTETGPVDDGDNRAYAWSIVALIQLKLNIQFLSPPSAARVCGLVGTCLYEAAALNSFRYRSSVGNPSLLRFRGNDEQISNAMDGAGYWIVRSLFGQRESFERVASQYEAFSGQSLKELIPKIESAMSSPITSLFGYPLTSQDQRTQAVVAGALACQRVIEEYTEDGFQPDGSPRGGQSLDVMYEVQNLPQRLAGVTDCDREIKDLGNWQPLCIPNGPDKFGTEDCTPQNFLFPFAGRFKPFALQPGDETTGEELVKPPPIPGTQQFRDQGNEVLSISASLGDMKKITAEYWADGPDSTAPPGHFFKIAADAAQSEGLSQMETARLLFIVGNAVYDAGIASWRTKTTFDLVRPLQMIQCGEFRGQERLAWSTPYLGVRMTNISEWRPYQASNFVTPPFAAYTSGHSTFSSAAAEGLRLFFGDDFYRGPQCSLTEKGKSLFEPESDILPGISDVPNQGSATPGYVPADDTVLCWDTYTAAADEAGISRLYGGIHIRADDVAGQELGRAIGRAVFEKIDELVFTDF